MAKARQASRKRTAPAVPRALWGLLAAVIILFVAMLAWLGTREPQPESTVSADLPREAARPAAAQQDARAVTTPAPKEPPKELAPPPPRYEFYNMLPAQKVEIPPPPAPAAVAPATPPPVAATDIPPAKPDVAVTTQGATTGSRFELQVGSFRRYEEADRRKAELALLGFSASIQSTNVNGETWHRVKVGPLPEAEARKVRDRLKAVGMNPLLVKQSG